jgi:hypothetical protein
VRQLVDHCRGNPLFLRELVTGALRSGGLIDEGGIWRLRGGLQPTSRLVELVALRLGELSGLKRNVLELITLGEPLGQAELVQLADPTAVETLEGKGLVTTRMDGRRLQVWLAHPVYGDLVRVGSSDAPARPGRPPRPSRRRRDSWPSAKGPPRPRCKR